MRTEKLSPATMSSDGRPSTSIVIAAMLVASAVAYVLLALQPGLVKSISGVWGSTIASGHGPEWAVPAMAAGIAIAAASLSMLVLSAFVRGVQRAPYLWLSPVLVGFSTLVLARLRVELPFYGVPLQLFALLAGLLLLGGGALVQIRGLACTLSGMLMLCLPSTTFIAGHAVRIGSVQAVWSSLNTASGLFLFVLALTSAGVGIVAWVTRPAFGSSVMRAREWQEHREQLAHALDRARISELHLAETERRAEVAEYNLRRQSGHFANAPVRARFDDTAAFVALARPGAGRLAIPFTSAALILATVLGAYFAAYRPMSRRLAAQQAFASEATKEHAEEIEALRKHFDAERAVAVSALAAEREKVATALQSAEQARTELAAVSGIAPAPEAKSKLETAKPEPRAVAKAPVAAHRVAAKSVAKPVPARVAAAKRGAHSTKSSIVGQPAETTRESDGSHGLKEAVDDDPIGGLDGM